MKRIFVAIASYRDPECQWPLKDLFESATHPQRISVGICWQFDPDSDQSCFTLPNPRPEQTRVINVGLKEARGACWAKSKALSLRKGEAYVLLIDSHNFGAVLARKAAGPGKPYVDEFAIDDRIWGHIDGMLVDAPGNAHEILAGARALIVGYRPPIVVNADNLADAEETRKFLRGAGYRLWSYACPFFSTENFFRQQENVFGNLASQCIVAVADDRDLASLSVDLVRLALME